MARPVTPLLTVDCVAIDSGGHVLFIKRRNAPYKGRLALPGGFVDLAESAEEACRRELFEETGVKAGALRLIGVYSKPGRDPRGPTVSIAYLCRLRRVRPIAGDDASAAAWLKPRRSMRLAFDHARILADGLVLYRSRP